MDLNRRFNRENLKKFQNLNGAQLKYIAFLSMLIDHVNNGIVTPLLDGKGPLLYISNIFSILGRIAFPIFIFFVV
ncbi:TraX family protein, partial [Peptoniphilus duerdenii]|uniref:TraX family protein n=1 Tax=Peptoniphilus duerdenii TaxID=507750 RepID=UPI0023EF83B6